MSAIEELAIMYPYHIYVENEVDLYQLDDGRYQTLKKGDISPIMIGYKYVLVENKVVEYFQNLEIERVTYKPATIWSRRTDAENSNYQEMIVHHHFESSQINDVDLDGRKFLLMDDRYLFSSPELKSVLSGSDLGLEFSEGLSHFA